MAVPLRTWIHVPVPALFDVSPRCTWLYATAGGSTWLCRPFSVCRPYARGCTPLDVDPIGCAGLFRFLGFVHLLIRLRTWFNVPVPVLFNVYVLFMCQFAYGRESAWLCQPFSVDTTCARGCTPSDVDPRGCAGRFRCVCSVHGAVRLQTCLHVAVPALIYTPQDVDPRG